MSEKPILVGVDGSDDSCQALRWAAEFGRKHELPVEALIAWDIPIAYGYPMTLGRDVGTRLSDDAREVLEETVRKQLGDDTDVVQRVERGDPAVTLVEAASEAQMLVVGTRGHGAFVGKLIGSVSQYCVQNAPCPVTVIRHSGSREPQASS